MGHFDDSIGRLMVAHARLKAIDLKSLSDEQKRSRTRSMRGLREKWELLIEKQYAALAADAVSSIDQLRTSTQKLEQDLRAVQESSAVLYCVASWLKAAGTVFKLLV